MPQDFARRRQANGAGKASAQRAQARRVKDEEKPRSNGLRLYLTGVLTGVFLSFLAYLSTLSTPVEQATEEAAAPAVVEVPKPRFDFYTKLPQQSIALEEEIVEPAAEMRPPAPPAPPVAAPQPYFLQAGSFRQKDDAERRRAELLLLGLAPRIEETSGENGTWFRVYLGPFDNQEAMSRTRALLAGQNIDSLLLKRDSG